MPYMVSIPPVEGFRTTMAPFLPASAFIASVWSLSDNVRVTVSVIVRAVRRSPGDVMGRL